ncbi:hypothetical protein DRH13_03575 [Candidatus Woesebacteria bacterium]|nr:MAG: hypothetical protein DRH13_03575 [Candidatus Woesebacteria bacterium]
MSIRTERSSYRYKSENKPKGRDFGTSIAPQLIEDLIENHGNYLVGEVVGTRSRTFYVIRGISSFTGKAKIRGLKASQLGDYTKSRPHIVFMPGNASAIITNTLRETVLATNGIEYRKILQEINEEGGNVEIPPEKKGGFNIF